MYYYTNMYCLHDGIEDVAYSPFGYFFFTWATGKADITACIASEPETLDPGLIASVDGATYTQHQFENLMKYANTGEQFQNDPSVLDTKIVNGIAESYTSTANADGTVTYVFTLRDANWSDGKPVTAYDFEYSWRRLVDPDTASDYGYLLDGIVVNAAEVNGGELTPDQLGVAAIDDKTFQVTLVTECPYFLEICAFASLMPLRQDVIEATSSEEATDAAEVTETATTQQWTDPTNIVVNGPYKMVEWVHDSYIKFAKNDMYYDAANVTGPDTITFYLSDSETAILSAYQAGEYDFIENFPADMIKSLQESGDCYINDYVGTYYLYLSAKNIPDWRIRAAITLVIDRENIVENVTQGGQSPATGITAAGIKDSTGENFAHTVSADMPVMFQWLQANLGDALDLDLSNYDDRCELAEFLVQEAAADGYDTSATIYYYFNTSATHQAIAEAVQSDVKSVLGLSFELANQDWNVYTTGLAENTFGLARLGWIADYNDATTYLELFVSGNPYNYSGWVSDEYSSIIAQAKAMTGGAARDALLYQAEPVLFSGTLK
ncbi:MAG TPA: peptide ABC transporter substrate-binding protein [Clostridiales bacterium]|nr:peptide ABC transporter substrate-binding protein [Clostridiales bacterium]